MTEKNEQARIRWRCRSGMLELDLFFTQFLDKGYVTLSEVEKQTFEALLKVGDVALFRWLILGERVDSSQFCALVSRMRQDVSGVS